MTNEEIQKQLDNLVSVYYKTHYIDKDVFSNPVHFYNNILFPSSVGTKIGSTGNKIGFLGATPIARQSAITAPTGGATIDAEARTAINSIRSVLTNFGLTS